MLSTVCHLTYGNEKLLDFEGNVIDLWYIDKHTNRRNYGLSNLRLSN